MIAGSSKITIGNPCLVIGSEVAGLFRGVDDHLVALMRCIGSEQSERKYTFNPG